MTIKKIFNRNLKYGKKCFHFVCIVKIILKTKTNKIIDHWTILLIGGMIL